MSSSESKICQAKKAKQFILISKDEFHFSGIKIKMFNASCGTTYLQFLCLTMLQRGEMWSLRQDISKRDIETIKKTDGVPHMTHKSNRLSKSL